MFADIMVGLLIWFTVATVGALSFSVFMHSVRKLAEQENRSSERSQS